MRIVLHDHSSAVIHVTAVQLSSDDEDPYSREDEDDEEEEEDEDEEDEGGDNEEEEEPREEGELLKKETEDKGRKRSQSQVGNESSGPRYWNRPLGWVPGDPFDPAETRRDPAETRPDLARTRPDPTGPEEEWEDVDSATSGPTHKRFRPLPSATRSTRTERNRLLKQFTDTPGSSGRDQLETRAFSALPLADQREVVRVSHAITSALKMNKPYRLTVLQAPIPLAAKAEAMQRLHEMKSMHSGSEDFHKHKQWIDGFLRIPFGVRHTLPVQLSDGLEACHAFMEQAQAHMDRVVYGLSEAKRQLLQRVGLWISNPTAMGSAIALHGPPGTGKTSLIREGVSRILNRPFTSIALGGAGDSSFLEGHSFTYEGSVWGRIVQILMDSKCMNPIIYFDELDKVSDSARGREIIHFLIHLIDTSQNMAIHDKYFAQLELDLSGCLFLFSYNDESLVHPVLKDRLGCIQTGGYTAKEKHIIAKDFLLPALLRQVGFSDTDVVFPEDTLTHLIRRRCEAEEGVRHLKRGLELILMQLNLYRLIRPGSALLTTERTPVFSITFPVTVVPAMVDAWVPEGGKHAPPMGMYM
jgi:flagellar biosynthesis GTPase FlhF